MTRRAALMKMERWQFHFTQEAAESAGARPPELSLPTVRARRRKQKVVEHEQ